MKFVKLQKASIKRQAALTDEQVNYLKENYKYTMFDPDSNNDHNELERDMEYEVKVHFDIDDYSMDENDFKKVTGLSYEQYDQNLENKRKEDIVDDFEEAKDNDIEKLKDVVDELELSWSYDAVQELIVKLQQLKHDGSEDLGYRIEHIMDGKHKRRL